MAEIYLAGVDALGLKSTSPELRAVTATTVGYAVERPLDTNYQEVKATDHAETVHVTHDQSVVFMISWRYYFSYRSLSVNKQATTLVVAVSHRHSLHKRRGFACY